MWGSRLYIPLESITRAQILINQINMYADKMAYYLRFFLNTDSLHRSTRCTHCSSPHSNNAGLMQHCWGTNHHRKDTKRVHDNRTGTGNRKGGSHDANGSGRADTGNGCGHADYKSKTMWESHADNESIAKPYTCSNGKARDESFTSSNWWGKWSHR